MHIEVAFIELKNQQLQRERPCGMKLFLKGALWSFILIKQNIYIHIQYFSNTAPTNVINVFTSLKPPFL